MPTVTNGKHRSPSVTIGHQRSPTVRSYPQFSIILALPIAERRYGLGRPTSDFGAVKNQTYAHLLKPTQTYSNLKIFCHRLDIGLTVRRRFAAGRRLADGYGGLRRVTKGTEGYGRLWKHICINQPSERKPKGVFRGSALFRKTLAA